MLQSKVFTSARIRKATFDPASGFLELWWEGGKVLAYKQVPHEVFRRLCAAPNPVAYWEDRIAEEYPKAKPQAKAAASDAAGGWGALFGGGAAPSGGDADPASGA